MGNEPLTLKTLLFGDGKVPRSEKEKEALDEVRKGINVKLPNVQWPDASKEIDGQIDQVLNQRLDELLVGVWSRYKGLLKYCDAEAYPPGKTVLSPLAQHKVKSSFKPAVAIQLGGVDVAKIVLAINLSLDLEGVVLRIDGGKIMALKAGSLQGVGAAEFRLEMLRPKLPPRNLFKPVKKTTKKRMLPVGIPFGEGVPIQRRGRKG